MAKSFTAASSQYYSATAAPITALPCTLAAWAFHTTSATKAIISLDTAAGNARVALQFTTTPNIAAAQTDSAGTTVSGNSGTASTSTWNHCAGVFESSTSRTAYVNGVAGSLNATANTFTAPDTVRIGATVISAALANYMNGRVAEVGVWNVALTASEIESLASGISPLMVRPHALVFYAPMLTTTGNQRDWVGGLSLAPTNTPTDIDHPAIVYPFQPRPLLPTATAPTISSTSDTNTLIDEASFVITGTNLTSATAVTFEQNTRSDYNATAFITANTATTITLTGLNVQAMGMAYGAARVNVTTAGGTTADFDITISPASGVQYVTLAGHTTGTGYATDLASANGDQLTAPTTIAGSTITLYADGNIAFTPDVPNGTSFTRQWFNDSDDTWASDTFQINGGASASGGLSMSALRRRRRT